MLVLKNKYLHFFSKKTTFVRNHKKCKVFFMAFFKQKLMKRKNYFTFLHDLTVFESIQKIKTYLVSMMDVNKETNKKILIAVKVLKE